jgi:hypothetical protein
VFDRARVKGGIAGGSSPRAASSSLFTLSLGQV